MNTNAMTEAQRHYAAFVGVSAELARLRADIARLADQWKIAAGDEANLPQRVISEAADDLNALLCEQP